MSRYIAFILRALLASLLLAAPASAAPLQAGQIILLTNSSGQQLSADVPEKLYLSPNSSAWEQWQLLNDSGGYHLVSFHGTSLIRGMNNTAAFHAPSMLDDGLGFYDCDSGVQVSNGTSACIVSYHPNSPARFYLTERNGSLVWIEPMQTSDGRGGVKYVVQPTMRWQVTVAPAPATGRGSLVRAITDKTTPQVISAHGTRLSITPPASPSLVPPSYQYQNNAQVLITSRPMIPPPLRFGDTVLFMVKVTSNNGVGWYQMVPSGTLVNGFEGVKEGFSEADGTWKLMPVGPYTLGSRVPSGKPVVYLQSSNGKVLSANPQGQLYLNNNSGAWEHWTLNRDY